MSDINVLARTQRIIVDMASASVSVINAGPQGPGGVGAAAAGGTDGQIQFNDGGTTIGGASALYYDDVNSRVGVGTSTPSTELEVDGTVTATEFVGHLKGATHILVKNISGGSLSKGTPVYATGSVGASGAVEVQASLANTANTMPSLGLLDETLTINGEGSATILGVIRQVDTSLYSVNDELYVAPSGGLTNTRPSGATELVQKIGRVVRSDASTGEILVLGAGRTNDVPNTVVANGLTINTDTLHVDTTNDRVGIGTTSPADKLHVEFTNGSAAGIVLTNSGGTVGKQGIRIGFDNDRLSIQRASDSGAWEANHVSVDQDSGNVGIGDTTPSYKLDVNGDINATGDVRVAGKPVGMVLVKSVSVGSGVSSVTVSNAFSSTFDNYEVLMSGGTQSVATDVRLKLGSSSTGYYGFLVYGSSSSGTVLGANRNNESQFNWVGGPVGANQPTHASFQLLAPYLSMYTKIRNAAYQNGSNYGTMQGEHQVASSYTSFELYVDTGTMTGGTIRVYGYNNG